jgi:hypothetical protein
VPNFLARSLLDQAGLPLAPLPAAPAPAAAPAPPPPGAAADEPPEPVLLPAAEMEALWWVHWYDAAGTAAAGRLLELNGGPGGLCRLLTSEDAAAQRQGAWAVGILSNNRGAVELLSAVCLTAVAALLGAADGAVVAQAARALASIGASGYVSLMEPLDDVPCLHLGMATLLAHGPDDAASDLAWYLANVADCCSTYQRDRLTHTPSLLPLLVALLEKPAVAHSATWALRSLSQGEAAGRRVAETGDLIARLPALLAHDDNEVVWQAFPLVGNLAMVEGGGIHARMAAVPGLFAALANGRSEDASDAVDAIFGLAAVAAPATCRQIAEDCLPYLAALLGDRSDGGAVDGAVYNAVAMLRTLARSDGGALRARVAAEPGAIAGLVALLDGELSRGDERFPTPNFAWQAARALRDLSQGDAGDGGEDRRRVIAAEEGVFPNLAGLLVGGTAAAEPAAALLANLSGDAPLRRLIASASGILPGLAALRDGGSAAAALALDLLALLPRVRLPRAAKRPRGG